MIRIRISRTHGLTPVLGEQLSHLVVVALVETSVFTGDSAFEIQVLQRRISFPSPANSMQAKEPHEAIFIVIETGSSTHGLDEETVRLAIANRFARNGLSDHGQLFVEFLRTKTTTPRKRRSLAAHVPGHASAI